MKIAWNIGDARVDGIRAFAPPPPAPHRTDIPPDRNRHLSQGAASSGIGGGRSDVSGVPSAAYESDGLTEGESRQAVIACDTAVDNVDHVHGCRR